MRWMMKRKGIPMAAAQKELIVLMVTWGIYVIGHLTIVDDVTSIPSVAVLAAASVTIIVWGYFVYTRYYRESRKED
jgi:hypothetical protein